MVKYSVTLPDGSKATRTSKKIVTHAVISFGYTAGATGDAWGVWSWNGSQALAAKQAKECAAVGQKDVRIVAVETI